MRSPVSLLNLPAAPRGGHVSWAAHSDRVVRRRTPAFLTPTLHEHKVPGGAALKKTF